MTQKKRKTVGYWRVEVKSTTTIWYHIPTSEAKTQDEAERIALLGDQAPAEIDDAPSEVYDIELHRGKP